jgi:hypothetical protein
MRKAPSTLRAVLWGAVVAYSTAAVASPVTRADFAGKTICWPTGTVTYGKNGSFDSKVCGHGNWRLEGDQLVTSNASCGNFSVTVTKENGTIHVVGYGGYETWGKYCK